MFLTLLEYVQQMTFSSGVEVQIAVRLKRMELCVHLAFSF